MTDLSPARRACCAACLRAESACICAWVQPVVSPHALLILQHPLEVANAKNSARLLHLCIKGSQLVVGERFDPVQLASMLHADGRQPLLLYPDTPEAPTASTARLAAQQGLRLVVLDATWRKSRKMLHENPLLQALPRLALSDMPASNYQIRKAHAPDQLSSLEATAYALAQLSGTGAPYAPLLASFAGFVAQQAAYVPADAPRRPPKIDHAKTI